MKVFTGFLFLFGSVCHVLGQRTSTQEVTAYCTRLTQTNQLQFEFIMSHKQDPTGAMYALDSSLNRITSGCSITYSNGVYTMTSMVSLATSGSATNGCGFQLTTVNSVQVYTWKLKYYEKPSHLGETLGLNRLYTASCNMSETMTDRMNATLTVSAPNLNQDVAVTNPNVLLSLLYFDGTQFQTATTNTQISTNTLLKLRLAVDFQTFVVNQVHAVAGLLTEVDYDVNFPNNYDILNANGCPTNTYTYGPRGGFVSTINGNTVVNPWTSETANFTAWQFDNAPGLLVFRVTYITCRSSVFNGNSICVNPCSHFTNAGRRRRDVEEEDVEERTAIVSIRIKNPDDNEKKAETSDVNMMVYLGSGSAVGVAVMLLVIVVVCSLTYRRRVQREDAKNSKQIPPLQFTNKMHY